MNEWRVEIYRAGEWLPFDVRDPFALVVSPGGRVGLSWVSGSAIQPPWRVWRAGALVAIDNTNLDTCD